MRRLNFYTFISENEIYNTAGILLREGKDWILIKSNYQDFQLDGYEIINKRYIAETLRGEEERFTEDVLKASDKWISLHEIDYEDMPLDDELLFQYLHDKDMFVSIPSNEKDYFDIGVISAIEGDMITLKRMDSWGEWMDRSKKYNIKSLPVFSIDTDYMKSLINYYVSKL